MKITKEILEGYSLGWDNAIHRTIEELLKKN